MKQYLPKKPVLRGFKVWVLADSRNGYFLDVDVYVGRPSDGDTTECGLGERVVLQLLSNYEGHNYAVFCDNFFSSPVLFDHLMQRGIYACGTVRQDHRGFPGELVGLRMQRGEFHYRRRDNLVATVWQDKRQVSMLSTFTKPDVTTSVTRRQRDGSHISISIPEAVSVYNSNMAGVDRGDQLRKYYSVRLKCRKYYKYIFWLM